MKPTDEMIQLFERCYVVAQGRLSALAAAVEPYELGFTLSESGRLGLEHLRAGRWFEETVNAVADELERAQRTLVATRSESSLWAAEVELDRIRTGVRRMMISKDEGDPVLAFQRTYRELVDAEAVVDNAKDSLGSLLGQYGGIVPAIKALRNRVDLMETWAQKRAELVEPGTGPNPVETLVSRWVKLSEIEVNTAKAGIKGNAAEYHEGKASGYYLCADMLKSELHQWSRSAAGDYGRGWQAGYEACRVALSECIAELENQSVRLDAELLAANARIAELTTDTNGWKDQVVELTKKWLAAESTLTDIADELGYVNRVEGMDGYERAPDKMLVKLVQELNTSKCKEWEKRALRAEQILFGLRDLHCLEGDYADEDVHPVVEMVERLQATINRQHDQIITLQGTEIALNAQLECAKEYVGSELLAGSDGYVHWAIKTLHEQLARATSLTDSERRWLNSHKPYSESILARFPEPEPKVDTRSVETLVGVVKSAPEWPESAAIALAELARRAKAQEAAHV